MKAKLCRLAFASILSTTISATLLADADLRYQLATKVSISSTLVFLGSSILLLAPAYYLISRFLIPTYTLLDPKSRIRWLAVSILIAAFLILVIPLSPPQPYSNRRLEIINNGQRNPLSKGNEIYLVGLNQVITRQRVPITGFSQSGEWQTRQWPWIRWKGMPTSTNDPQAKLIWAGSLDQDIEIIFWSSPQAGIAQIVWDGQTQTIDLYAERNQDYYVTLPVSSPSNHWIAAILYYPAYLMSLGLITLSMGLWLVHRKAKLTNEKPKGREILLYALPCSLVWSVYLLTFWPGIMSPDSVTQWGQALTGNYIDSHPVFHTFNIWLITQLWSSPALLAITQIAALSLTVGWALFSFRQMGVARSITWLICIVFALYPPNGSLTITLWKDVPYSISVLILTIFLFKIVLSRGQWLEGRLTWIILALVAALTALYRHNGIPVAIISLVALLPFYKPYWRQISAALFLSLITWVGIRQVLHSALKPGPAFPSELFLEHAVASHVVSGTPLTPQETDFLSKLASLTVRWDYYCDNANFLVIHSPIQYEAKLPLIEEPGRITRLFIDVTLRRPITTINHYICATNFAWQVRPGGIFSLFYSAVPKNRENRFDWVIAEAQKWGIKPNSQLPVMIDTLKDFGQKLNYYSFDMVYRPAAYFYLFLAGISVASARMKEKRLLLVAIPISINTIVIGLLATEGEFRYLYPTYLTCLLLAIPILFCIPRKINQE